MEIKVVITADQAAIAFATAFGKLFNDFVAKSDVEGSVARVLQEVTTIEPDTYCFEDTEAIQHYRNAPTITPPPQQTAQPKAQPESTPAPATAKVELLPAVALRDKLYKIYQKNSYGLEFREVCVKILRRCNVDKIGQLDTPEKQQGFIALCDAFGASGPGVL